MKIWIFPPLAFVWPSKIFLAFFQFSWPSDILNIQNQSNLSYFETILSLKQFLLKIWQSGSVCGAPLALSILLAGAELCGGHNGGCTLYEFAFILL